MKYNSRKSNFYDSHAQREMTLARSGNTMVAVKMRGTDRSLFFGWGSEGSKYQCRGGDEQQSRVGAQSPQQESDSASPSILGLTGGLPV